MLVNQWCPRFTSSGAIGTINDFDINLTLLSSLVSSDAITTVPCRVVYSTLLAAALIAVLSALCCVQIGALGLALAITVNLTLTPALLLGFPDFFKRCILYS